MDKNNKIPDSFKEYLEQKSVQVEEEAQQDTEVSEARIQKLEGCLAQCTSQEYVDDFRQNCENSGLTIDEYAKELKDAIEREMNSREL